MLSMKRTFLLALIIIISSISCTSKDNLIKYEFDITIERDFPIIDYQLAAFTKTADIVATDESSDFEKYKEDIESVVIKSASYMMLNVTANASQNINSAAFSISDVADSGKTTIASISNVNLLIYENQEQSLSLNNKGVDRFNALISNSPYSAMVHLDGSANEVPIHFTIRLKLVCRVTVLL